VTRPRKVTPAERAAVVAEYQDGVRVEAIAVAHCVSRALVSKLRRAAGVCRPGPNGRAGSHIEAKRAAWHRRQELVRRRTWRMGPMRPNTEKARRKMHYAAGVLRTRN
jgi:transposase-like protein